MPISCYLNHLFIQVAWISEHIYYSLNKRNKENEFNKKMKWGFAKKTRKISKIFHGKGCLVYIEHKGCSCVQNDCTLYIEFDTIFNIIPEANQR